MNDTNRNMISDDKLNKKRVYLIIDHGKNIMSLNQNFFFWLASSVKLAVIDGSNLRR